MKDSKGNADGIGKVNRRWSLQSSIALASASAFLNGAESSSQTVSARLKPAEVKQLVPFGSGQVNLCL